MTESSVDRLIQRSNTIEDLSSVSALLGWDQETYMPDGAAASRSEHKATVSALLHELYTSGETATLVEKAREEVGANGENGDWKGAFVREFARRQDLATKLPTEFVREMSKATSIGQHSWRRARQESDFSLFSKELEHIVDIKRRHAEYLGYAENPYDALLDLYEPGITAAMLRPVFARLKVGTIRLLEKINGAEDRPDDSLFYSGFDRDRQLEYSREVIGRIGFSFDRGRVDLSAHPFCTSFTRSDVRLTTRVYEDDLRSCLFGLIHEAGHGMYEQGVDPQFSRTALEGGASMGIHESQSLFWENVIGRSREFWQWAYPRLQQTFPEKLSEVTAEDFYRMVNTMRPSLIRVEADELTYNLHIILRFEIEDDLINRRLEVAEIPEVWNRKMVEYLGIEPENDALGCLQDVHWSFGGHGYFPSYTLGKLYAAMFNNRMLEQIPDRDAQIASGEFEPTLAWLRENVHRWGRAKTPTELLRDVCGSELSEQPFLDYIERKIVDVYRVS